ncbi:MAG: hypothetical protein JWP81_1381 [Ferruginibacter sp.]|nr:hypothetical protein [Ferruginibacter sp.]
MLRCCITIVFVITSIFSVNGQTTVVLNPVKDNTIFQDATGNSNGAGVNIFAGNTANGSPRRALLKFDIAAQVPAGATITAVTLSLFCNKVNTSAVTNSVSIHPLLVDWGEGSSAAPASGDGAGVAATTNDATWVNRFHPSNAWTAPGGDFSSTASATTGVGGASASYSWTSPQVITEVQAWLNNPSTNFGWILIGAEASSGSAKRFSSRENSVAAQRPQLSVTYIAPAAPTVFTFTGTGNWDVTTNWSNNTIPPANLAANTEIIIDPPATGECILNVPQTIQPGGKITVQPNKKLTIAGNLIIQ